jgi:predicted transcriptional regulator
MSVRIMSEVFEKSRTQGNARLVLLALADSCNDDASCWPSIRKIAEKANISEPITKKYLNALIQIGVITRDEREDFSGRQTSNLYTINVEKIGDDEITQDVIHQVTSPSRLKTFKGVTAVNVGGDNPVQMVVGITKVSLPIMNHHNEPKIEPSPEAIVTYIENDHDLEIAFPRGNNDGIANAIDSRPPNTVEKVNSVSCAQIPPKTKSPRKPKLVDDAFITELKRLNPDKDVDKEVQMARTWILAKPERQFTQQFLSGWINRSKNTIKTERFSNF